MTWLPEKPAAPLPLIGMEEAAAWQHAWVEAVARSFAPLESPLLGGDLGIGPQGQPEATLACARALAEVFGAQEALLVRGGGTGASGSPSSASVPHASRILVHRPQTYLTTRMTLEAMGVELVPCDFNSEREVSDALDRHGPGGPYPTHAAEAGGQLSARAPDHGNPLGAERDKGHRRRQLRAAEGTAVGQSPPAPI